MNTKLKCFGALMVTTLCVLPFLYLRADTRLLPQLTPWLALLTSQPDTRHGLRHTCTNTITKTLRGHWEEHQTEEQKLEMYEYYDQRLKERSVPYGIQRPDGKCGQYFHGWYRALCRPGGPTPCCYNDVCVNTTKDNCTCPDCFDLRAQIEADYATWRSEDPACQLVQMSVGRICSLLRNATIYFIGDSQIRHLYAGFAMVARGTQDKLFHTPSTSKEMAEACSGRLLFANKKCWVIIARNNPHLCNDTVRVRFLHLRSVSRTSSIVSAIASLRNTTRSLVVLGIGLDDRFDYTLVQRRLWTPLLQRQNHSAHPKLVWMTPHHNGLFKAIGKYYHTQYHQDTPHLRAFTVQMEKFLSKRHVPVMNLFKLTQGVVSHDGTHHGTGVNRVKALVLLHHIEELHRRGEW